MPESPEVDALAGFLRTHIVGRQIAGLELVEYGALKTRGRLTSELVGRAVTGIRRFGKRRAQRAGRRLRAAAERSYR